MQWTPTITVQRSLARRASPCYRDNGHLGRFLVPRMAVQPDLIADGAPIDGAPSHKTRHAKLPSVHLILPGRLSYENRYTPNYSMHPLSRHYLPRHASRGWSRVGTQLPCPDVLRSVTPFYDVLACLETPLRNQFVISIDRPLFMRLPALS